MSFATANASLLADDDTFEETLLTLNRRVEAMNLVVRNFKSLPAQQRTKTVAEVSLECLETYFEEYKVLDRRAHRLATEDAAKEDSYFKENKYSAYLAKYVQDKSYLRDVITQLSAPVIPTEPQETTGNDLFKLERIKPDKFSGDMSKWNNFKSLFDQLVHNNAKIPIIQKFFLLRNSLEGEPFNLIENIQITEPNYATAYKLLIDRYEDGVGLIWTHLKELFAVRRMRNESAEEARRLHDQTVRACEVLANLKREVNKWDDILVYLMVNKMDVKTREHYELHTNTTTTFPTFADLKAFMDDRAKRVARVPIASIASRPANRFSVKSHHSTTDDKVVCPGCNADHYLNTCTVFKNKSIKERREFIASKGLCFNCFQGDHGAKGCSSSSRCRNCQRRHHTLLCESPNSTGRMGFKKTKSNTAHAAIDSSENEDLQPNSTASDNCSSDEESGGQVTSCQSNQAAPQVKTVILATAKVRLRIADGRTMIARALLDQGSELSFISETAARALRAPRINTNVTISGVNGNKTASCRSAITCSLEPCDAKEPSLPITAYVLPRLTSYIPRRPPTKLTWKHLQGLKLADPDPDDKKVDVIIGADLYSAIILEGVKRGSTDSPMAQETVFGWVISGPLTIPEHPDDKTQASVNHCVIHEPVDDLLRRFWELEEVATTVGLTEEDEWCKNHFKTTHTRGPDGRYIVHLPLKSALPLDIGESFGIARKCYERQEKKLESKPQLKIECDKFFQDYLDSGHMRLAPKVDDPRLKPVYLSHLAVLREDSTTSPVRMVFNASGRTTNGTTLNDHLYAGPQTLPDLPTLITRWRRHAIALKADIKQMFRQVWVTPMHVHLQRILWKSPSAPEMEPYELLTVTYGEKPAPSLSSLALEQLADDEESKLPRAAQILRDDFYVDDALTGARTIEEAREIQRELQQLLQSGGFTLRKWACSHPVVLRGVPPELLAHDPTLKFEKEVVKVLGVLWDKYQDAFKFSTSLENTGGSTKREILSTVARMFDPAGWLTPTTIVAKILIQELWLQGLDWDDQAPDCITAKWKKIHADLKKLEGIRIPRYINITDCEADMELHGFCDASKQAYAAVVYIRARGNDNQVKTHLIMGKSKVAPIKQQTIAKLELCAAHLLARLLEKLKTALGFQTVAMHAWTDSEIVLAWLKRHASHWPTFIANRISDIQTRIPTDKHHVPTTSNPADCASRGILPGDLVVHEIWWTGPKWLQLDSGQWPQDKQILTRIQIVPEEITPDAACCAVNNAEEPVLIPPREIPYLHLRISSWQRLLGVTTFCLKFLNARTNIQQPGMSLRELTDKAEVFWLKRGQEEFEDQIKLLRKNRQLAPLDKLARLHPVLDEKGVLRVGGRINNAPVLHDQKHPVILPAGRIASLLIDEIHQSTLHGGLLLTLSTLRQKCWILNARRLVKSHIRKCGKCIRYRGRPLEQIMAPLPAARVSSANVFSHTGIDYAGPVNVRTSFGRGHKSHKGYIALFVCLTTRAIHLELVSDYSSQSFLAALDRFSARHGLPSDIYSDNATTFQGAERELREAVELIQQDAKLRKMISDKRINWHFIPANAPHFGGLWEAGVKSVKGHLKKLVDNQTPTFEEWTTLLCKIECNLNSRPIGPLHDDPEDIDALTPGHFLAGKP